MLMLRNTVGYQCCLLSHKKKKPEDFAQVIMSLMTILNHVRLKTPTERSDHTESSAVSVATCLRVLSACHSFYRSVPGEKCVFLEHQRKGYVVNKQPLLSCCSCFYSDRGGHFISHGPCLKLTVPSIIGPFFLLSEIL